MSSGSYSNTEETACQYRTQRFTIISSHHWKLCWASSTQIKFSCYLPL